MAQFRSRGTGRRARKLDPSDPKLSLTRRLHARLRALQPDDRRERPGSPRAPAGTSISQRPFVPLQRLPVSRQPFRDRSSRPPLRCVAERSSSTFGSLLLRSIRLAPVRARSPPQTRFLNFSSAISICPWIAPALLGFCAPADQISTSHRSRGSPSGLVRLPFAPRRLPYWDSFNRGSTFPGSLRIRSARCSSNLLEPSVIF
jgi:hypothetical protein